MVASAYMPTSFVEKNSVNKLLAIDYNHPEKINKFELKLEKGIVKKLED